MAKKSGKRGNGEGYIGQRKDGRWEGKLIIGYDAEGKPKRVSYYGKTRREVQEKMDQSRTEIRIGTFAEPTKGSFGEWLLRWLEIYKKPNLRLGTYGVYSRMVKAQIVPILGNVALQALKPDMLQEFFTQKIHEGKTKGQGGLDPSYIRNIYKLIKACLDQAVKNRYLTYNPAMAVEVAKVTGKEMTRLTRDQLKIYLDTAKGEALYPAILLETSTGLRKGELAALRWRDMDIKLRTLTVNQNLYRVNIVEENRTELIFGEPKTATSKRTIPLLPDVVSELKRHKSKQAENKMLLQKAYQDQDLVFSMPDGKPLDPRTLYELHKRIIRKAKLPDIPFHALRHTFGSILAEEKEDPKVIQRLLGHANISTTYNTYITVDNDTIARSLSKLESVLTGQ